MSPHSWHFTPAVVLEYSSASFRAGFVVSPPQTPVCVTVSVIDRSCASVDSDAGIRTPVGGAWLISKSPCWSEKRGGQVFVRFKVFGKRESLLPDWWV